MAWMILITACALCAVFLCIWRQRKLKKEIYGFTEFLEEKLDAVIAGKPLEDAAGTEDSLAGRVCEKLKRVQHIWELQRAESERDRQEIKELLSDISHQTKTPVANQKLYIEILKREETDGERICFLEKLEQQTDKLDFLLHNLIKMTRLETGVIQIRKQEADLMRTVGRAVSQAVCAASEKKIRIFVEAEDSVRLLHDAKWTEEAVYNLLDNAVKYTQKGGKIRVSVIKREMFTEIRVRDNGRGIAKERQAQIFGRFYREPEVHEQEGISVGLYLARKIAELQNGYIEVESEPQKGAEFKLYLPNH